MADCLSAHAWWLIGFSCFCIGVNRINDVIFRKTFSFDTFFIPFFMLLHIKNQIMTELFFTFCLLYKAINSQSFLLLTAALSFSELLCVLSVKHPKVILISHSILLEQKTESLGLVFFCPVFIRSRHFGTVVQGSSQVCVEVWIRLPRLRSRFEFQTSCLGGFSSPLWGFVSDDFPTFWHSHCELSGFVYAP